MSRLRIYSETDGSAPLLETSEHARIADELGRQGVRFERWATRTLVGGADRPTKCSPRTRRRSTC